jgi:hypothetical protein
MVTPFFHRRDCAIEGNASGRAVTQRAHFRIPDDERWLHETQAASDLARAVEWSQQQPASEIQTDALLAAAAQSKQHGPGSSAVCHHHPSAEIALSQ